MKQFIDGFSPRLFECNMLMERESGSKEVHQQKSTLIDWME